MTDPFPCSRCGGRLPAAGAECPLCLLRLGQELPPRDPGRPGAPGSAEAGADAGAAPDAGRTHGAGARAEPPRRPVALPLEEVARRFPQLEIKALLGQGGMGVVYLARQPRLGRDVALKLLPPEQSADAAFAERFLREARAMARLSHPNIVAVHDFGETDGLCWLLMDYVDGVNLRQALRSGALPPEKALAIVPQMCDALQYAHDEGVVHRDIKPENVLLDRQGRVKLVDFGLAKLLGPQELTLTGEHQVFGTPHYMAPEQMEAACDVDHRADIFSLGVVFYEMLTGKLPTGRFAPPSRHVTLDVRLDDVVLHALEHEASRRYQHAAEVKTDVASVVAGRDPEAARAALAPTGGDLDLTARGAALLRDGAAARGGGVAAAEVAARGPSSRRRKEAELAADDMPGWRHWWRGPRDAWLLLALLLGSGVAWRVAAELGARGRWGATAGLVLLAATAWACLQLFLRRVPALRAALASEGLDRRSLRAWVAWCALFGALLLLGVGVLEGWEHGTRHYVSDSRSAGALLAPPSAMTDALLATCRPGQGLHAVERVTGPAFHESGVLQLGHGAAFAGGALLLLVFGAALAAGAPGRPRRSAWAPPVAVVPALLLGGLGLAQAWSGFAQQAEEWPALQAVTGGEVLDVGVDAAGGALREALSREGYAVHAGLDARLLAPDGAELARERDLALEPEAPWDRWSLEDGLPRRRRPHVLLRLVGDDTHSVVFWDCGHVRPLAAEPESWRAWMAHVLQVARESAMSR